MVVARRIASYQLVVGISYLHLGVDMKSCKFEVFRFMEARLANFAGMVKLVDTPDLKSVAT